MGLPLHSLTATNALLSSSSLAAGGTANFGFNAPSRSGTYTGTIEAQWTNGSAVIPCSVAVSIVDPGDLGVNWDENAQKVTVVNKSHHTLWVHVGNELRVLESNRSTQFERTGDKTTVVFSINGKSDRTYTLENIDTPLPTPPEENLQNLQVFADAELQGVVNEQVNIADPASDRGKLPEELESQTPAEAEDNLAGQIKTTEANGNTYTEVLQEVDS